MNKMGKVSLVILLVAMAGSVGAMMQEYNNTYQGEVITNVKFSKMAMNIAGPEIVEIQKDTQGMEYSHNYVQLINWIIKLAGVEVELSYRLFQSRKLVMMQDMIEQQRQKNGNEGPQEKQVMRIRREIEELHRKDNDMRQMIEPLLQEAEHQPQERKQLDQRQMSCNGRG